PSCPGAGIGPGALELVLPSESSTTVQVGSPFASTIHRYPVEPVCSGKQMVKRWLTSRRTVVPLASSPNRSICLPPCGVLVSSKRARPATGRHVCARQWRGNEAQTTHGWTAAAHDDTTAASGRAGVADAGHVDGRPQSAS